MEKSDKIKLTSKIIKPIMKNIGEGQDDPFKRRGSVSRSPPSRRIGTGDAEITHAAIAGQLKKKSAEETTNSDKISLNDDIFTISIDENLKSNKSAPGKECSKLEEIRQERIKLEEFLFNENNKISRAAIKFILGKWMYLEGIARRDNSKLQEEIIETQKLKHTYLEL